MGDGRALPVGVVGAGGGLPRVAVLPPDRSGVGRGERFGLGWSLGDCVAALDVGVDAGQEFAGLVVGECGEVHVCSCGGHAAAPGSVVGHAGRVGKLTSAVA